MQIWCKIIKGNQGDLEVSHWTKDVLVFSLLSGLRGSFFCLLPVIGRGTEIAKFRRRRNLQNFLSVLREIIPLWSFLMTKKFFWISAHFISSEEINSWCLHFTPGKSIPPTQLWIHCSLRCIASPRLKLFLLERNRPNLGHSISEQGAGPARFLQIPEHRGRKQRINQTELVRGVSGGALIPFNIGKH